MKKILCVASECTPFAKTGGLADVMGALPKYYDKKKIDVRVMLPGYRIIPEEYKKMMTKKIHYQMDIANEMHQVDVYELKFNNIIYYFIFNNYFFLGDSLYENANIDIKKFIFFDKACLESLKYIEFWPDVIHCNDWQTGLIPVYLKDVFAKKNEYANIKTVMTIHNLQFQGKWNVQEMKRFTGISEYMFTEDKLVQSYDMNFLKGGIVFADYITTVSKTYSKEISSKTYAEGLDKLMLEKKDKIVGIINGIDYEEYNPSIDKFIYSNYNENDFRQGKPTNKENLQKEFGLDIRKDCMLIGLVSRLTKQKGMELIEVIIDQICDMDVQFIVLGTGETEYENLFRHYASRYSNKISANIYFSEEESRKIYAGCDAFLMPSLFEPCGLSQLISFKYGTIPIVRETGGLKDTVISYNECDGSGSGFTFRNFDPHEMLNILRYANYIYKTKKDDWDNMVERCMKLDFSWKSSAKEYEKLFDRM